MRARASVVALTFTLAVAGPAGAQGVPVIDASSIAQLVTQLDQMRRDYATQLEQLTQLREQYANMVEQLDTLRQQYAAVTGPRGIGGVLNTVEDIRERDAAETLGGIVDGSIFGDLDRVAGNVGRITARLADLRATYELDDLDVFAGSEEASDRAIAEVAGAGMASVATAEDAYARANAAMDRVSALIGRIDDSTDIKASTDFNTRMLAEVAGLLAENLRAQAAVANAQGAAALADARDRAAQRKFMELGE